jgi:uncharacterized cupin superfamily protein
MAEQPNIHEAEAQYDGEDPEGYRAGMARFGTSLGAEETGLSVYELPPGQSICPYHYEYGEEEWLIVVAGRPTLRTPAGEQVLEAGDVAFFPTGPEGAHKVTNNTDEAARVLMFSNLRDPNACVYPDSDKISINTGNRADDIRAFRSSAVDYFEGEPL